jgi:hypothetical protein
VKRIDFFTIIFLFKTCFVLFGQIIQSGQSNPMHILVKNGELLVSSNLPSNWENYSLSLDFTRNKHVAFLSNKHLKNTAIFKEIKNEKDWFDSKDSPAYIKIDTDLGRICLFNFAAIEKIQNELKPFNKFPSASDFFKFTEKEKHKFDEDAWISSLSFELEKGKILNMAIVRLFERMKYLQILDNDDNSYFAEQNSGLRFWLNEKQLFNGNGKYLNFYNSNGELKYWQSESYRGNGYIVPIISDFSTQELSFNNLDSLFNFLDSTDTKKIENACLQGIELAKLELPMQNLNIVLDIDLQFNKGVNSSSGYANNLNDLVLKSIRDELQKLFFITGNDYISANTNFNLEIILTHKKTPVVNNTNIRKVKVYRHNYSIKTKQENFINFHFDEFQFKKIKDLEKYKNDVPSSSKATLLKN